MSEDEAVAALRGDDADAAAQAAATLWRLWTRSGDPEVDRLLAQGVSAMEAERLAEADGLFGRIIARAPAFAEGWNKRATARYLAGDYAGAIADCEETLARKPHHFGALSGQGLCHMALGQFREAAALFRRTLAVYPHLTSARNNLAAAVGEAVKGNGHSAPG
jgi:tetratricopeptide (TPR) repeat protein